MHTHILATDAMHDIHSHLDRINILLQEVLEDYFSKYDRDNREDHLGIVWEFRRAGIKSDIISDELLAVADSLKTLETILGGAAV